MSYILDALKKAAEQRGANATVLPDSVFVGEPVTANLSFSDPGVLDTRTAMLD